MISGGRSQADEYMRSNTESMHKIESLNLFECKVTMTKELKWNLEDVDYLKRILDPYNLDIRNLSDAIEHRELQRLTPKFNYLVLNLNSIIYEW